MGTGFNDKVVVKWQVQNGGVDGKLIREKAVAICASYLSQVISCSRASTRKCGGASVGVISWANRDLRAS